MSPGAPHVLSQAIFGLGPVLTDFLPDSFRTVSVLPEWAVERGCTTSREAAPSCDFTPGMLSARRGMRGPYSRPMSCGTPNGERRPDKVLVVFSQLFPLGIALAREFIGQSRRLESS